MASNRRHLCLVRGRTSGRQRRIGGSEGFGLPADGLGLSALSCRVVPPCDPGQVCATRWQGEATDPTFELTAVLGNRVRAYRKKGLHPGEAVSAPLDVFVQLHGRPELRPERAPHALHRRAQVGLGGPEGYRRCFHFASTWPRSYFLQPWALSATLGVELALFGNPFAACPLRCGQARGHDQTHLLSRPALRPEPTATCTARLMYHLSPRQCLRRPPSPRPCSTCPHPASAPLCSLAALRAADHLRDGVQPRCLFVAQFKGFSLRHAACCSALQ